MKSFCPPRVCAAVRKFVRLLQWAGGKSGATLFVSVLFTLLLGSAGLLGGVRGLRGLSAGAGPVRSGGRECCAANVCVSGCHVARVGGFAFYGGKFTIHSD